MISKVIIIKMKTQLKLFRQETGHTCTCAVARMLLDSKGIVMSEMDIEKSMGVDELKGASVFQLMSFLKEHDIETELVEDSSIDELKKGDFPKLLMFMLWGEIPHVAIVEGVSEDRAFLLDPATGRTQLRFDELIRQWEADGIS